MTPIALTPAARGKRAKRSQASAGHRQGPAGYRQGPAGHRQAPTGHRGSVRRTAAPAAPRRVSGPARPASRAGTVAPRPARKPAPRTPRKRARLGTATAARPTLGARAVAFVRALPDHQLLDRIVRGRAWIPILGVLLAGIVAMQVEVLKLGAGIGRSIERGTQLQSRNELLRASVATLADDQRIETLAAGMGMVMPAPTAVSFLSLKPVGYVQRAAASVHRPDPTTFLSTLPSVTTATGTTDTGTGATGTSATATGTSATGGGATTSSTVAATSPGVATSSSSTGGG